MASVASDVSSRSRPIPRAIRPGSLYAILLCSSRLAGPLAALALLVGCGGAAPRRPPATVHAEPAAPSDETEQQRRIRIARAKRSRCQEIGSAIGQGQGHAVIVNVDDTRAAEQVAAALAATADRIAEVTIASAELEPLRHLRDGYADTSREMAGALRHAAHAAAGPPQKQALRRFSRLEPELARYLADLDEYCNAPVD